MIVEVVLRHVGQRRHPEAAAVQPPLIQRLRRRFQDDVGRSGGAHLGEQRVQGQRPRRGQRRPPCPAVPARRRRSIADRADDAGIKPRRRQHRLDQIRRRRLAVGAGHRHQVQRRRRAETIGGDRRQRLARTGHRHHHRARRRWRGPLGDDDARAAFHRRRDEGAPVGRRARHGDEQIARLHQARIVAHLGHGDRLGRRAGDDGAVHAGQQR